MEGRFENLQSGISQRWGFKVSLFCSGFVVSLRLHCFLEVLLFRCGYVVSPSLCRCGFVVSLRLCCFIGWGTAAQKYSFCFFPVRLRSKFHLAVIGYRVGITDFPQSLALSMEGKREFTIAHHASLFSRTVGWLSGQLQNNWAWPRVLIDLTENPIYWRLIHSHRHTLSFKGLRFQD